jgi:hypothetical protein
MKWPKTWKLWAIAHGNGGTKHEKHVFLWRFSKHVSACTVAGNHPGSRKMCAIAHEMGKKMKTVRYNPLKWRLKTWKTRVFAPLLKPCTGRYVSWKSSEEPKNVRYSQWNGQRTWKLWAIAHGNGGSKHEKQEFLQRLSNHVSVVTLAGNHPGNWKMCAIGHEMAKTMKTVSYSPWKWRHKTWKTRIFVTPLKTCIGMYGSRKSSREPENMRYSPWNEQKHENCEL